MVNNKKFWDQYLEDMANTPGEILDDEPMAQDENKRRHSDSKPKPGSQAYMLA